MADQVEWSVALSSCGEVGWRMYFEGRASGICWGWMWAESETAAKDETEDWGLSKRENADALSSWAAPPCQSPSRAFALKLFLRWFFCRLLYED